MAVAVDLAEECLVLAASWAVVWAECHWLAVAWVLDSVLGFLVALAWVVECLEVEVQDFLEAVAETCLECQVAQADKGQAKEVVWSADLDPLREPSVKNPVAKWVEEGSKDFPVSLVLVVVVDLGWEGEILVQRLVPLEKSRAEAWEVDRALEWAVERFLEEAVVAVWSVTPAQPQEL